MKHILVLFLTVCSLSACKKNNETLTTPFNNTLSFKLDGVDINCNANIEGRIQGYLSGENEFSIKGGWPGGSILLDMYGYNSFTTGTYIFQPGEYRRAKLWINIPSSFIEFIAGIVTFSPPTTFLGSGQIIITEVNTEYVKGTFSFVTGIEISSNTSKTVTDGQFHIKLSY